MNQQPDRNAHSTPADRMVAGVRFSTMGKIYHFDAGRHRDLIPGDFVLVDTARGQQLGEVVTIGPPVEGEDQGLKPVGRRATGRDMALRQQWQRQEEGALEAARQVVDELGVPLKVVAADYSFDGKRLTLLYVSEEKKLTLSRIQQRLKRQMSCRVDMRRVGPRDHAKLLGGYGACGEPRCCARFLSTFSSVSIKMAKTQGVSLNPSEITGMCGRLRCCLLYEQEQYQDACKVMPRRKRRVRTPHGEGKVVDLLPLKGVVVVQVEDRRVEVPAEDVEPITAKK